MIRAITGWAGASFEATANLVSIMVANYHWFGVCGVQNYLPKGIATAWDKYTVMKGNAWTACANQGDITRYAIGSFINNPSNEAAQSFITKEEGGSQ